MNVLVVANYFDRDGLASKVLTEGKFLAPLGVRLVIVVPKNPFARAGVAAKLQALGMKHYSALTHFRSLYLFLPLSLWKISRIIGKEKIDLLHVHHGKTLVLGVLLSRLHGIPLVYTIHGVSRRELPRASKNFLFRYVSRVFSVSEESAAYFRSRVRYPAQQIIVHRNAIDFSHFAAQAQGPNGYVNVLYMSRLDRDKWKAVEAVMDAVLLLLPEQPRLRLRILGDGRQYEKVKKKALGINAGLGREVIALEGWADDPAGHLAKADMVLGVGRCALEAIAAGKSVLVVGNEKIGGWVTENSFMELQKTNFSGRGSAAATSGATLISELKKTKQIQAVIEKVRIMALAGHEAGKLAAAIHEIYLELHPEKKRC